MIAFAFLAFLPMLVGGSVAYQRLQSAQQNDSLLRVEALAANQVSQLDEIIRTQRRSLELLAEDPVWQQPERIDVPRLRDRIDRYDNGLVTLAWFDADQRLAMSSDASLTDRLENQSFPDAGAQPSVGFIVDRASRPVHQMMTSVVRGGEITGWILAEFGTTAFADIVNDYSALGETGENLIVRRVDGPDTGGTELLFTARHSERGDLWLDDGGDPTPAGQAASGQVDEVVGVKDYRGKRVVAATRYLEELDWGLVVKQESNEALEASQDFRQSMLIGMGVGLILIVGTGWWVGRRFTDPLIRLRDVANAVAQGDFSERARIIADDEIGDLSRSFNIMTTELVDQAEREAQRTKILEETNQRLVDTENRTQTILETAAEGIIETDRIGIITGANAAAEEIFGATADLLLGESINEFVQAPPAVTLGHVFHVVESEPEHSSGVTVHRPDGSEIPAVLAVSRIAVDGDIAYTGLIRDISERVAFEKELEFQATHDALTGLPNRKVLATELDKALVRSANGSGPLALFFLDLDRFKQVNDTLGHQAGDELLRQVVSRSRNALRPEDLLSRFGGDEFVVLAEGIRGDEDALEIAERIRAAHDEPFLLEGTEVFTSVSVGVVVATGGNTDAEQLLGDADNAMYRAKETGRNRIEVFDVSMREEVEKHHDLDMALRKASGNDELRFAYQPVIDVDSGKVAFVEALARWDRPGYGPVAPDQFIEMAEQSGLISTLGPKLLAMAVEQLAAWNADHPDAPVAMSVNVSSQQLTSASFIPQLKDLLDESGIDPSTLILEMTETAVVRDLEIVVDNLELARSLGVVVAVDDFGSGYSSLGYLRELPIDILKMDRMFVVNELDHRSESSIIDMVVSMSKALDITIVAEGVETADQFSILRELGCQQIQGYVITKPLSPEELVDTIWDGQDKRGLLPEGVPVRVVQD